MICIPFEIDRSVGTNREIVSFNNAVFPGLRNIHYIVIIGIKSCMIIRNGLSACWQCIIGYDWYFLLLRQPSAPLSTKP